MLVCSDLDAIHEASAGDDLGKLLGAIEASPAFLGFKAEFKYHGQGGQAGAAALGSLRAEPDGGKGGFNGVSGAQVRPVFGREVVKGKEHLLVFFQAVA